MDIIINYILFQKKKKKKKRKKSQILLRQNFYTRWYFGVFHLKVKKKKKKKIRKQFGGKIRAKCTVERSNIISSL